MGRVLRVHTTRLQRLRPSLLTTYDSSEARIKGEISLSDYAQVLKQIRSQRQPHVLKKVA